mmetsp:Transcript_20311/g.17981  ORF Transcript_20311/g.17981 Transcript_20311/m.17981 type:complete len:84 (+) Transcript_20311:1285-1536(+)
MKKMIDDKDYKFFPCFKEEESHNEQGNNFSYAGYQDLENLMVQEFKLMNEKINQESQERKKENKEIKETQSKILELLNEIRKN